MKKTDTILDKIVAAKRDYLKARKAKHPQADIERKVSEMSAYEGPGFFDALKAKSPGPKIIAEVKQASPSGGVIRENFSLAEINDAYQSAPSVTAISVITEKDYFRGSEEALAFFASHNTNHKPLLRKDFIFDPYQIIEAKLLGASAYLLIASLFDEKELAELVDYGQSIGLEPLVEVHTEEEMSMATSTKARVIGVNARDLRDFSIDVRAHDLLAGLDDSYARVAESGIDDPDYLERLTEFCDAVLVGTSFMAASDIMAAIDRLTGTKAGSVIERREK